MMKKNILKHKNNEKIVKDRKKKLILLLKNLGLCFSVMENSNNDLNVQQNSIHERKIQFFITLF